MRENVVDEMRQMQPDDETKRKMLEILKRLHSEEESDSIEEETDSMEEDGMFLLLFFVALKCSLMPSVNFGRGFLLVCHLQ